jgi:hypothetical protein
MDIKPVKDIEKPRYPLKTEVSGVSLKKALPGRWTRSAAAKVALGALAAVSLAGCAQGSDKGIIQEPFNDIAGVLMMPATPGGKTAPAMINVAPLFLHGEGRGAFAAVWSLRPRSCRKTMRLQL